MSLATVGTRPWVVLPAAVVLVGALLVLGVGAISGRTARTRPRLSAHGAAPTAPKTVTVLTPYADQPAPTGSVLWVEGTAEGVATDAPVTLVLERESGVAVVQVACTAADGRFAGALQMPTQATDRSLYVRARCEGATSPRVRVATR